MGIGMLQPMHLFIILVMLLVIIAAGIGGALVLIRYAVRYNRQLDQRSHGETTPKGH